MDEKHKLRQITVVIPSLEPNSLLINYVNQLVECGFCNIIIINDGSGEKYDDIFTELAKIYECTVLTQEKNLGKGDALKKGYKYVTQHLKNCQGIVTADSDGQHTVADVCSVAREILSSKGCVILGSRDFSGPNIPPKSKIGNRLSSVFFWSIHGVWLADTQTGLRGFDSSLFEYMIGILGERFEYEMQVLVKCAETKIPIKKVTIQTIYDGNNEGTHFQPIKDSIKIAKVLLSKIYRYTLSSGLSSVVDLIIAFILLDFLAGISSIDDYMRISLATFIARICSMTVNYTLNKKFVFAEKNTQKHSNVRYFTLCIINMILSAQMLYVGHIVFAWSEKLLKILIDTILFILNFQIQRIWVFQRNKNR